MKPEAYAPHGPLSDVEVISDVEQALAKLKALYQDSCHQITSSYEDLIEGTPLPGNLQEKACYPYLGIDVTPESIQDHHCSLSFGMADTPGPYGVTLTRPELFESYYREQLQALKDNHGVDFIIGKSRWPIPLPFVMDHVTTDLTDAQKLRLKLDFALPNLTRVTDDIVNANHPYEDPSTPFPLGLFHGERVDYSLNRIHHYTGTAPEHFQGFVLLTNYQQYINGFFEYAKKQLSKEGPYTEFVMPRDQTLTSMAEMEEFGIASDNLPQMPAYHLKREDGLGISFINIGVGPTNAKNITDHLAVLRPNCWIMLGHCAGLRPRQRLGDYALAHAYLREDLVLDEELPQHIPLPAIAEIQVALQQAVANITGLKDLELKQRMRTGTVVSVADRNWELRSREMYPQFRKSRAIALDMESATIAGNGFRFRVPYGTLLCVSDKPIQGEIKLRGAAQSFYQQRVRQHLDIGIEAIRLLRDKGVERLHSRKLRSFDEPPFR